MTNKELLEQIEKSRQAALAVMPADPDVHAPVQVNPVVQEALDAGKTHAQTSVSPSSKPGAVNVTLGGALNGATIPFTPGVAEEKKDEDDGTVSFYELLLRNGENARRAKEDYERNEKSNRARTRIAAVSDALSSLGNLVGTMYGAPSQTQTYQTPLIAEQAQTDREYARKLAQMLYQNDQSLRLAKMKMDATQAGYDRQLAVQDAITQRAYANALARAALEDKRAGYKSEQIDKQIEGRKEVAQINAASAEKRTGMTAGTSRANKQDDIAFKEKELEAKKNGEIGGGSGGVAGYTTETEIHRNEYGQETGRTTTRTPANGKPSTTTTSKTPPSKQKKAQSSKTPPSRRKK